MAAKKSSSPKPSKRTASKGVTSSAKKSEPKRMGRPPKKPSERKASQVGLRLSEAERDELLRGAALFGETITAFVLTSARERVGRHSA